MSYILLCGVIGSEHVAENAELSWRLAEAAFPEGLFLLAGPNIHDVDAKRLFQDGELGTSNCLRVMLTTAPIHDTSQEFVIDSMSFPGTLRPAMERVARWLGAVLRMGEVQEVRVIMTENYDIDIPREDVQVDDFVDAVLEKYDGAYFVESFDLRVCA